VRRRIFSALSLPDAVALARDLQASIPLAEKPALEPTGFVFLTDSESSGRGGCSETPCRLARVMELARFAALYSEVVYIPNYFSGYPSPVASFDEQRTYFFRERLVGDITIALALKPCLTANIVRFVNSRYHFCSDCAAELALDKNLASVEGIIRNALPRYSRRSHGSVTVYPHGYSILTVDGPREIFPHPWSTVLPQSMLHYEPRSGNHKQTTAATSQQVENEVRRLLEAAASDVTLQTILSAMLGTTYLTDDQLTPNSFVLLAPSIRLIPRTNLPATWFVSFRSLTTRL